MHALKALRPACYGLLTPRRQLYTGAFSFYNNLGGNQTMDDKKNIKNFITQQNSIAEQESYFDPASRPNLLLSACGAISFGMNVIIEHFESLEEPSLKDLDFFCRLHREMENHCQRARNMDIAIQQKCSDGDIKK